MKKEKKIQEMNYQRLMPERKKAKQQKYVLTSQHVDFMSKDL